jgi:polyphosphate kinase
MYLSSADWMKRNLSRRIEAAFPVYDKQIKQSIKDVLEIQFRDNVKARIVDEKQDNTFKAGDPVERHRSQYEVYDYWRSKN